MEHPVSIAERKPNTRLSLPKLIKKNIQIFIFYIIVFLLFNGCPVENKPVKQNTGQKQDNWLLVKDGILRSIRGISTEENSVFKPWTEQERIADMLIFEHKLICVVNGKGIISLKLSERGEPLYACYIEPAIFTGRTASALYPFADYLIVHLFEDDILKPGEQVKNSICFVKYSPGTVNNHFRLITSSWQKANAEYQAVYVNPLDDENLAVEWKLSSSHESKFKYTLFKPHAGQEEEKDREWFLANLHFISLDDPDIKADLHTLFDLIIREMNKILTNYSIYIRVRDFEKTFADRYKYESPAYQKAPGSDIFTLLVINYDGILATILPGGKVIIIKQNQAGQYQLPLLPAHYAYTSFAVYDGYICAAWEEQEFTQVGKSGLLLWKIE